MQFPSDLLKPVVALPVVLGVLAIAGWWAYASERSELATTRETLAAIQAEQQSCRPRTSSCRPRPTEVRSTLAETEQAAGDLETIQAQLVGRHGDPQQAPRRARRA